MTLTKLAKTVVRPTGVVLILVETFSMNMGGDYSWITHGSF